MGCTISCAGNDRSGYVCVLNLEDLADSSRYTDRKMVHSGGETRRHNH